MARDFNRKMLKIGQLVTLHNPTTKKDPKYEVLYVIYKIKHKTVTIMQLEHVDDKQDVPDVWLERHDL